MRKFSVLLLLLIAMSGCGKNEPRTDLPGGYKIWIMNAHEIYLSKSDNELLVGPALRKVGVAQGHIVAWCDEPDKSYTGDVRTVGYSVIDLSSGSLSSSLTEDQAREQLKNQGSTFPEMKGIEAYSTTD